MKEIKALVKDLDYFAFYLDFNLNWLKISEVINTLYGIPEKKRHDQWLNMWGKIGGLVNGSIYRADQLL